MATNEVDSKIETIIISEVNRLYKLAEHGGLELEDLKCFEILCKIKKDYNPSTDSDNKKNIELTPDVVRDLIKKAQKKKNDE
jgi:hypothetical protein